MLVSLDGKPLRASFDRATASSPLHMLSAWCSDHGGLVVGQLKTDSKSNEITAIPDLLQLLPKFCAKIAGVKTIQIAPNLAYFLRFEVLETEGCQHDKATRSISNAP